MSSSVQLLKALADGVRLRILRAVSQAELSVAELVRVVKLPQSTVSRHLKSLREVELLATRRDGTSIYYRLGSALQDPIFVPFLDQQLQSLPGAKQDEAAVRHALALRNRQSREFFNEVAGRYGSLNDPGGGWSALAAALAVGFANQDVADLGAGEGDLTLMLARFARSVAAVDASPEMIRHLQSRVHALQMEERVRLIAGELEAIPLADAAVDCAFLSQALHHVGQPQIAIREAARILRPGGWLVVLDLNQHDQEWMREHWADLWLGFEPDQITTWMINAGLEPQRSEALSDGDSTIDVLLIAGQKQSIIQPTETGGREHGKANNRAEAQVE